MKLRNEKVNAKFVLDCLKNSIYKDSTIFKCNDVKSEEALNAIIKYWDSVSEEESEFSLEKFTRWKFTKNAKDIISDIGLTNKELNIKNYHEYTCAEELNEEAVEALRPFYHIVKLSPNEIYYKEMVDSLVHTVCISSNLTEEKLNSLNPYTLLRLAMEHGSPSLFDKAIANGASPFCDLATALFKEPIISLAIKKKYTYIVKWLIHNMPDHYVYNTYEHGKSLLHLLVDNCNCREVAYYYSNLIKELVKKGAVVNAVDDYGNTPLLDLVSINERLDYNTGFLMRTLLSVGSDIDVKDIHGRTPLHLAALNEHSNLVYELIDKNADVNAKDNDGATPLHLAVAKNEEMYSIRHILYVKNININAQNVYKRTPLMIAVEQGKLEYAAYLLSAGADVKLKDREGNTVMHYYAKMEYSYRFYENLLTLLLKFGADINAKNFKGQTPLDYIRELNGDSEDANFEIEAELIKRGAIASNN